MLPDSLKVTNFSYQKIRHEIKDGDVLLYEGHGLYAWAIKKVTHSRFSHSGITVWWNERLMVMEAAWRGVMVSPLSINLKHYNGRAYWYTCRKNISPAKRKRMIIFAQEELGKEYAFLKAAWLGIKILFNRTNERRDKLRRGHKLFCSYYVSQIYNSIGLDLKQKTSDALTTPEDIDHSPILEFKGILKK